MTRDVLWKKLDEEGAGYRPDEVSLFGGWSAGAYGTMYNYHWLVDDLQWLEQQLSRRRHGTGQWRTDRSARFGLAEDSSLGSTAKSSTLLFRRRLRGGYGFI